MRNSLKPSAFSIQNLKKTMKMTWCTLNLLWFLLPAQAKPNWAEWLGSSLLQAKKLEEWGEMKNAQRTSCQTSMSMRMSTAFYNTLTKNPHLYYVLIFHGNLDLFYYNIHAFLSSISLNIGTYTALLKHIQALYPIIASQHTLKFTFPNQHSSSVLQKNYRPYF